MDTSQHKFYDLTKRLFDIVCAILFLILISPVLLIISIFIKIDSPGPIFYKTKRIGRWGKPFYALKFRTMYPGDQKSYNYKSGDAVYKIDYDQRVTKVGRFLRKTSLHEIPQLFNILRGEMSLVGPRPLLEYEEEFYRAHYRRRLEVIPGMTGLQQIQAANSTNFDEMVKLDIWYIEHRSFWLDLKLFVETVPSVLRGRGAY